MACKKSHIRALAFALAPLALGVATAPVHAQVMTSSLHAGTLEVPLNKSQVVTTDRAIAKAMVGNPEVADILPLTDRSVYLLGKAMGTTSLTLYDSGGRVLAVMDVAVGPDVQAFRSQLSTLLPGQQIEANISGDSMVLTGVLSDPGAVDRAVQLARTYAGEKVVNMMSLGSTQQVMLEVKFAEVRRSVGEDIGVQGIGVSEDGSFNGIIGTNGRYTPGSTNAVTTTGVNGTIPSSGGVNAVGPSPNNTYGVSGPGLASSATQTLTTLGSAALGTVSNSFGIFSKVFGLGSLNIDAILTAMEQKGMARTLAEPTLVSLSGEKASFLAGGEFPIPVIQGSGGSGNANNQGITVEFKPFGVSLGFTPTVLADRTINLKVEPEVSSIDPAASIVLNGLTIPGLQTRRASTTLELRDGESFAIAGLLQEDFKTTVTQVPLLGNIPILGALFRSTEFQKGETELLIVVTPRLVKPIRPDQVRLPTDRVREPEAVEVILTGESYDPQPMQPQYAPAQPAPTTGNDYEY